MTLRVNVAYLSPLLMYSDAWCILASALDLAGGGGRVAIAQLGGTVSAARRSHAEACCRFRSRGLVRVGDTLLHYGFPGIGLFDDDKSQLSGVRNA